MRWRQHLRSRLIWFAFGAIIGGALVWSIMRSDKALRHPAPAVSVTDPFHGDPEQERQIGAKLAQIKPGMARREVEALLGPPHRVDERQINVQWRRGPDGRETYASLSYVVYYCSPPHLPPSPHLMTVVYEGEPFVDIAPDARVVEVSGPHIPNDG